MIQPVRRLYRSREDLQLAGICGGLGTYLQVDPVALRLVFVAVTIFTGIVPGALTYLAAWLIVPQEPIPLPARRPEATNENQAPA